jgi:hypothetical protein
VARNVGRGDLDNLFSYHAPVGDQVETYQQIRQAGRTLAEVIIERVPPGDDRDWAIETVRDAVMRANAAVACAPSTAAFDTGGGETHTS